MNRNLKSIFLVILTILLILGVIYFRHEAGLDTDQITKTMISEEK